LHQGIPLAKLRADFELLYYDQQTSGLLRCKETTKTTGHPRKESPTLTRNGKRLGSFEYYVKNGKGVDQRVCQKAFCFIHGFSAKRLQVLRTKMNNSGGNGIEYDNRGKHSNRQRIGEDVKEKIRQHILSYPARSSHYSHDDNSHRTYLSPHLSIARLYRDFLLKHQTSNKKKKITTNFLLPNHLYLSIFIETCS